MTAGGSLGPSFRANPRPLRGGSLGGARRAGQRAAQIAVQHQGRPAPSRVEAHLHEVHTVRRAAQVPGEGTRRAAQPFHLARRDPHARAPARSAPARLHLDDHEHLAFARHEVELGVAGDETAREDAEAAPGQPAFGEELPRAPSFAVVGETPEEQGAGREGERDPAYPRRRTTQDSFASRVGSSLFDPGPLSSRFCTAARAKRMRTPSATCRVTTSSLIWAMVP